MLRAVKFILIAAMLLGLAWWVGGLPGTVVAHSGPYTLSTSVPAALLILFLIAVLFTVLLRVIGGVRRAPGGYGAWRGGRRQKLGEIATRRALVALAAGDAPAAKAEATRAQKLLGETPMVLLLSAEAARLAGDDAQAQAAFTKLTSNKEMAFLGHRGLLRTKLEAGEHDAAASHAQAAETHYPGSAWLRRKRMELAIRQEHWSAALALTREPAEVAALATGAALASTDKRRAVALARQAVQAAPEFAPAIIAYAQALRALGKTRAAKNAYFSGWRAAPDPAIATAFLSPITAPIERVQAAAELAGARPGHPESAILLAQTSLAAQLTGEARRHAEAAIAAGAADGRAAAILAELDGKPAPARAIPGFVCAACHAHASDWAPACPRCHRPGSLVAESAPPAPQAQLLLE